MSGKDIGLYLSSAAFIVVLIGPASAQSTPQAGTQPAQAGATASKANPTPGDDSPLGKANSLYRSGKLAEAEEAYKAIIRDEPKSVVSYIGLTHVYLRQNRVNEAYQAATKAIELAPSFDAARTAIGEVYFRQGKMHEAEQELTPLVKSGTGDARAYMGLGLLYWSASFYRHGKMMLDRAYGMDSRDPDIRKSWIQTLGAKERMRALQSYLSSVADNGDHFQEELMILKDESDMPDRPCRLTTRPTSVETHLVPLLYDAQRMTALALQVQLNGTSSKLELDTGAGGILVNRKIAEKAGVKRIADIGLGGIGDKGEAQGYIGYVDSITVANLEFKDCYVRVIDKASVIGEDGLIGADVFSSFLVDLDLPDGKFKLSKLPDRPEEPAPVVALQSRATAAPRYYDRYIAPEMQSFTPIFRFGHDLLIPTVLNDSARKLFLIDTGAFGNTISTATAKDLTKLESDSDTKVKGISGEVKDVKRANRIMIQFGRFKQLNEDMVAFDISGISNSIGTDVSGILGFPLLHLLDIKIDYRDGLVDFNYDPHRFH
ncbi:MAG TPA: aspartyl protease family protein [Blastocatellia bacterium]